MKTLKENFGEFLKFDNFEGFKEDNLKEIKIKTYDEFIKSLIDKHNLDKNPKRYKKFYDYDFVDFILDKNSGKRNLEEKPDLFKLFKEDKKIEELEKITNSFVEKATKRLKEIIENFYNSKNIYDINYFFVIKKEVVKTVKTFIILRDYINEEKIELKSKLDWYEEEVIEMGEIKK